MIGCYFLPLECAWVFCLYARPERGYAADDMKILATTRILHSCLPTQAPPRSRVRNGRAVFSESHWFYSSGRRSQRLRASHCCSVVKTHPNGMSSLAPLLFVLESLCAFPQTMTQPSPIRPVDGPDIFRNYCAPCHGIDGRGKGSVSKALRQRVPDLTTVSRRNGGNFPGDHVRKIIMLGEDTLIPAHGSKRMPIWGPVFHEIEFDQDLGNVRLENVTTYLQSIQRRRGK